jgi:hypothetical protein
MFRTSGDGLTDDAIEVVADEGQQPVGEEAVMTTVYVITAGGGDTYRIERVYLDRDVADESAQDYEGIASVEHDQAEGWQIGAPPGPTTARTSGQSDSSGCPLASVAASYGIPVRGSDSTTSTSTRIGGPATPSPTPRWCAANSPGSPGCGGGAVEAEGGGAVLRDNCQGQDRSSGSVTEVVSVYLSAKWKQLGMAARHCRPWCVMIPPWTNTLEQLGHHIVSRRVALGYRTRTDLANSLQLTVRTLADIENGIRRASPGTYAMLDNKLGWAPGSIDTILAGGEPKELVVRLRRDSPEPRYPGFTTDALSRASTDELLLELRRRIIRPRDRRRETWDDWDDGLDSRGDWSEES